MIKQKGVLAIIRPTITNHYSVGRKWQKRLASGMVKDVMQTYAGSMFRNGGCRSTGISPLPRGSKSVLISHSQTGFIRLGIMAQEVMSSALPMLIPASVSAYRSGYYKDAYSDTATSQYNTDVSTQTHDLARGWAKAVGAGWPP